MVGFGNTMKKARHGLALKTEKSFSSKTPHIHMHYYNEIPNSYLNHKRIDEII